MSEDTIEVDDTVDYRGSEWSVESIDEQIRVWSSNREKIQHETIVALREDTYPYMETEVSIDELVDTGITYGEEYQRFKALFSDDNPLTVKYDGHFYDVEGYTYPSEDLIYEDNVTVYLIRDGVNKAIEKDVTLDQISF